MHGRRHGLKRVERMTHSRKTYSHPLSPPSQQETLPPLVEKDIPTRWWKQEIVSGKDIFDLINIGSHLSPSYVIL